MSEERPGFMQPKPGASEGRPPLTHGDRGEQKVQQAVRPLQEIPQQVPDNLISDADPD